ncbi:MAG: hypothetical protein ACFFAJ_17280 [Candidatus Hodarchaeota archaeon]
MQVQDLSLQKAMEFLNYYGPICSDLNEKVKNKKPRQSVELVQDCVSEIFLFYSYLKQGFLVNSSPFFKDSYFRVRYFNYDEGKYWP